MLTAQRGAPNIPRVALRPGFSKAWGVTAPPLGHGHLGPNRPKIGDALVESSASEPDQANNEKSFPRTGRYVLPAKTPPPERARFQPA
eukprot:jgi/Tetstr1/440278/TSEL_028628.t1